MMDAAQKDVVTLVYRRFLESETDKEWTDLDDAITYLGWLYDEELIVEAMVKYAAHSKNNDFRCKLDHKKELCMAPIILEAVEAILLLHEDTKELHEKNKYLLTYYLAMAEVGLIYSGK